jgi:hypothetical protein
MLIHFEDVKTIKTIVYYYDTIAGAARYYAVGYVFDKLKILAILTKDWRGKTAKRRISSSLQVLTSMVSELSNPSFPISTIFFKIPKSCRTL